MVVPNFVRQALRGHPLAVFGDGTQTRCFTYVTDVVGQLIALAEEPRAVGEVWNVGQRPRGGHDPRAGAPGRPAHRLEERDRARALRPRLRGGLRGHAAAGARPLEAARAHRVRAEGAARRDPRPRRRLLHLRRHAACEAGRVPPDVRGGGGAVVVRRPAGDRDRSARAGPATASSRSGPGCSTPAAAPASTCWRSPGWAGRWGSTSRRRRSPSAGSGGSGRCGRASSPFPSRAPLRRRHLVRRALPRLGDRRPRGGRRDGARRAPGRRAARPRPGAAGPVGGPRRRGPVAPPLHAR